MDDPVAEAIFRGFELLADRIGPNPGAGNLYPTLTEGPVMSAEVIAAALNNVASALHSIAEAIEEHV